VWATVNDAHTSSLSPFSPKTHQNPRTFPSHSKLILHFHSSKSPNSLLQASRRTSNLDGPRNWSRSINSDFADDHEDGGDDDEAEEEDRSLDLLVRFISNVFKKVSKRARKAVRSVLPVPISTKLVITVNRSCSWISWWKWRGVVFSLLD
jgi:hypothetical protein